MSGILDGLRGILAPPNKIKWVKAADVREALLNPTDEEMVAMCRVVALTEGDERPMTDGQVVFVYSPIVRAVLAAAAGGDQR